LPALQSQDNTQRDSSGLSIGDQFAPRNDLALFQEGDIQRWMDAAEIINWVSLPSCFILIYFILFFLLSRVLSSFLYIPKLTALILLV